MGGALKAIGSIGGAITDALGGGDIFSKIKESFDKICSCIGACCGGNCSACAGGSAAAGCSGGG